MPHAPRADRVSIQLMHKTAEVVVIRAGDVAPDGDHAVGGVCVTIDFDYEPAPGDTGASRIMSEAKQVLSEILQDWPSVA